VHGFCGAYAEAVSSGAEDFADGGGFGWIVAGRCSAVGVDVADLFGGEIGVGQGAADCAGWTFYRWLSDVMGVGGHAEACQLGVDFCAASAGGFERLEDHHAGAFAQDHAAAIYAEWAASIRRDHSHSFPGFQAAHGEGRFAASRDRQIHFPSAHHLECLSDRMI